MYVCLFARISTLPKTELNWIGSRQVLGKLILTYLWILVPRWSTQQNLFTLTVSWRWRLASSN